MSNPRYQLTPKVAPFLDPSLFQKIEEFNGKAVAASSGSVPTSSEPSLAAAQQLYDAGKYLEAHKMLSELTFDSASEEYETLQWGKLAAALLAFPEPPKVDVKVEAKEEPKEEAKEEDAEEEVSEEESTAPELVDQTTGDPVLEALAGVQSLLDQRRGAYSTVQLNRRAWLIHWSLFAYFNGRLTKFVETVFYSQYMSVIQAACPWILRYVIVAVISTHSRTTRFDRRVKDATRVVQQELYEYSDPVLEFIQCLDADYDFDSMAEKLDAAAKTLADDFFAHKLVDKFVDSARVLIADTALRVHEFLPQSRLQDILGLKGDSSKWISEYIASKQESKLDATFNQEKGIVRVNYAKSSVNSQVSDKIKAMDQKAHQLQQAHIKKTDN